MKASIEVATQDELIRPLPDRPHTRKYSPPHRGDGEEDARHKYFPSGWTNNAGNNDLEFPDHKKDSQFGSGLGEGLVLDTYGMLLKKSIVLEDGTVRTFFTLPSDTSDPLCKPRSFSTDDLIGSKTVIPYSTSNINFDSSISAASRYEEDPRHLEADSTYKLQYNRLSHGQVFDKEERDMMTYLRSAVYPINLPQSKISALASGTSRLPIGSSYGEHRDSLHAWSEDFLNGKLCDASESEMHGQRDMYGKENGLMRDMYGKENGSVRDVHGKEKVLHIENLSSNDLHLYLSRDVHRDVHGVEVAAYTENIRGNGSETTLMPRDSFNKGRHILFHNYNHAPQREESWQHGSVRSRLDVHKTDCMENTIIMRNHFRGVNKDTTVQNDLLDDYENMHESSSLRAISSGLHEELFRSRRDGQLSVLRMEVSGSPPTRHVKEECPFGKEASVVDFRETARNHFPEAAVGLRGSNLSALSRSQLPIRELDMHGPDKRVSKRNYIDENNHRGGLQRRLLNGQGKHRKLREIDLYENEWTDQEGTSRGSLCSGRSFHDEVLHRVSVSRSISMNKTSDMRGHLSESKPRLKISSPLKRTRSKWCYDDNSSGRKEEQDFHHPHRFQKHSSEYIEQDRSWNRCHEQNDLLNDREPVLLSDLPEDSEAFKQQVQKAFLRFAKVLNENPGQRKRYKENGKCGSLLCIVCSRLSKDFVNTHSLVMHAFNSQKVGVRAEHLGLHKALCVLMGWNYAVAPNNANVYQLLPAPDAITMKEDLILWPPLVIIHTYIFEKKQDGCQDVIGNLEMDDILRGLGLGSGKSKAVDHCSASQGTFVVKFFPTFSGLQEAERLHKYCKENHHGRNDWIQVKSLHRSQRDVGKDTDQLQDDGHSKNRRVFYGYIGIAGDLEKVDFDTRKRSLVKSRKDIEAIADGPVLGA